MFCLVLRYESNNFIKCNLSKRETQMLIVLILGKCSSFTECSIKPYNIRI